MPNFVVLDEKCRSYNVTSIFQDGGNGEGNLLPGSGLVTALI